MSYSPNTTRRAVTYVVGKEIILLDRPPSILFSASHYLLYPMPTYKEVRSHKPSHIPLSSLLLVVRQYLRLQLRQFMYCWCSWRRNLPWGTQEPICSSRPASSSQEQSRSCPWCRHRSGEYRRSTRQLSPQTARRSGWNTLQRNGPGDGRSKIHPGTQLTY